MSSYIEKATAETDFNKARNLAGLQSIFSTFKWKNPDLLSFYEVTKLIKPKAQTYKGMRTIRVDRIIGSESRYHDFSSAFMPKSSYLRNRWESIDRARMADVTLPPISVYSVGGYYFVRDGNHRVSVAKAQGVEFIDAEVVELDSEIKLEPGMTMKTLKKRVVMYERDRFMEEYKPSYIPMGEIVFTTPGAYAELVNHINTHKYYMNQNRSMPVSFEEGARHWYSSVYQPIVQEIRREHMLSEFPGQTEGDMYFWLVKKWDERKKLDSLASIESVAKDSRKEIEKGTFNRYLKFIVSEIKRS